MEMQVLARSVPAIYLIVGAVVAVIFAVDWIAIHGFQSAFFKWTYALALVYMWISLFAGTMCVVFTTVQLAVLDLHQNKEMQFDEEKRRLGRLLLTVFLLALPPMAVYVTHLRYDVQVYIGSGVLHEGSLVYGVAFLFFCAFFLVWSLGRQRGWI